MPATETPVKPSEAPVKEAPVIEPWPVKPSEPTKPAQEPKSPFRVWRCTGD